MSEKSVTTYTALHLRSKLRVPPRALLAESREAASAIASAEGLIWKIWVLQEEQFEMGGIYLFADRDAAKAYLNHPVIQAVTAPPLRTTSLRRLEHEGAPPGDVERGMKAIERSPARLFFKHALVSAQCCHRSSRSF